MVSFLSYLVTVPDMLERDYASGLIGFLYADGYRGRFDGLKKLLIAWQK